MVSGDCDGGGDCDGWRRHRAVVCYRLGRGGGGCDGSGDGDGGGGSGDDASDR